MVPVYTWYRLSVPHFQNPLISVQVFLLNFFWVHVFQKSSERKTIVHTYVVAPVSAAQINFCCHITFLPTAECVGASNLKLISLLGQCSIAM